MFWALLSWQNHCESSPGSLYKIELRQAADDPQTKPINLECESACRLPESTPTITIYYYQLSVIKFIQRAQTSSLNAIANIITQPES